MSKIEKKILENCQKWRFLFTFPVPPLNKGTLNSLKIMEPSPERSAEHFFWNFSHDIHMFLTLRQGFLTIF